MGFFLGKDSGVKFISSTRGITFNLYADEWSIEIASESIDITSIKPLRDENLVDDLSGVPDWLNYGIPKQRLEGGVRDTKLTISGFIYWDTDFSRDESNRVPIIGEKGEVQILYTTQGANRRPLFTAENAVVNSAKYDTDISSGIRFEIEFHCLTTDVDKAPNPDN